MTAGDRLPPCSQETEPWYCPPPGLTFHFPLLCKFSRLGPGCKTTSWGIPPPLFLFSSENHKNCSHSREAGIPPLSCLLDCPEEGAGQRVSVRSGVKQNDLEDSRSTDHSLTSLRPQGGQTTKKYKFTCRLRWKKEEKQVLHLLRSTFSEYLSCGR